MSVDKKVTVLKEKEKEKGVALLKYTGDVP